MAKFNPLNNLGNRLKSLNKAIAFVEALKAAEIESTLLEILNDSLFLESFKAYEDYTYRSTTNLLDRRNMKRMEKDLVAKKLSTFFEKIIDGGDSRKKDLYIRDLFDEFLEENKPQMKSFINDDFFKKAPHQVKFKLGKQENKAMAFYKKLRELRNDIAHDDEKVFNVTIEFIVFSKEFLLKVAEFLEKNFIKK